jgi:hypothetical protein
MSGGIYLIQANGTLVEMKEQAYETEDFFQNILAEHPNLLAGDLIDNQQPRRWLFISREVPVPAQADGVGQWALDHLFSWQRLRTLLKVAERKRADTGLVQVG